MCVYASGRGALPGHLSPSLADLSAPGVVRSSPRVTCVCAPQTLRNRPIKKMYSRFFNVRQSICIIQGSLCPCTTGGQEEPHALWFDTVQDAGACGCNLVEIPTWAVTSHFPNQKNSAPSRQVRPDPTDQTKQKANCVRPCALLLVCTPSTGRCCPLPASSFNAWWRWFGVVPGARCWGWWVAKSVREKGAFP